MPGPPMFDLGTIGYNFTLGFGQFSAAQQQILQNMGQLDQKIQARLDNIAKQSDLMGRKVGLTINRLAEQQARFVVSEEKLAKQHEVLTNQIALNTDRLATARKRYAQLHESYAEAEIRAVKAIGKAHSDAADSVDIAERKRSIAVQQAVRAEEAAIRHLATVQNNAKATALDLAEAQERLQIATEKRELAEIEGEKRVVDSRMRNAEIVRQITNEQLTLLNKLKLGQSSASETVQALLNSEIALKQRLMAVDNERLLTAQRAATGIEAAEVRTLSAIEAAEAKLAASQAGGGGRGGTKRPTLAAFGSAAGQIGTQAAVGAALLLGPAGMAAKAASEYQDVITAIRNTGKVAEEEIGHVNAAIRTTARDTGVMQEELAKGLLSSLRAGRSLNDSLLLVSEAAISAKGTNKDFLEVLDALNTAMNTFSLKAQDAHQMVSIMQVTVGRGNVEWKELANALGTVGPLASKLGLTVQDIAASIEVLRRHHVTATVAGGQLLAVFQRMAAPSKQMRDTAEALGLHWFAVGEAVKHIKEVGFPQVLEEINRATKGSPSLITQLLGGQRGGGRAAINLLLNDLKDFKDAYGDATHTVTVQSDAAAAADMRFSQQLKYLKADFHDLEITIGIAVLPKMDKFIKAIDRMILRVDDAKPGFKNFIGTSLVTGGGLLAIVAALTLTVSWLARFASALKTVVMVIGVAGAADGVVGALATLGVAVGGLALVSIPVALWVSQLTGFDKVLKKKADEWSGLNLFGTKFEATKPIEVNWRPIQMLRAMAKQEEANLAKQSGITKAITPGRVLKWWTATTPRAVGFNQDDVDALTLAMSDTKFSGRSLGDLSPAEKNELAGILSEQAHGQLYMQRGAEKLLRGPSSSSAPALNLGSGRRGVNAGAIPAWEKSMLPDVGRAIGLSCGEYITKHLNQQGIHFTATQLADRAHRDARFRQAAVNRDSQGNLVYPNGTVIFVPGRRGWAGLGTDPTEHFMTTLFDAKANVQRVIESTTAGGRGRRVRSDRTLASALAGRDYVAVRTRLTPEEQQYVNEGIQAEADQRAALREIHRRLIEGALDEAKAMPRRTLAEVRARAQAILSASLQQNRFAEEDELKKLSEEAEKNRQFAPKIAKLQAQVRDSAKRARIGLYADYDAAIRDFYEKEQAKIDAVHTASERFRLNMEKRRFQHRTLTLDDAQKLYGIGVAEATLTLHEEKMKLPPDERNEKSLAFKQLYLNYFDALDSLKTELDNRIQEILDKDDRQYQARMNAFRAMAMRQLRDYDRSQKYSTDDEGTRATKRAGFVNDLIHRLNLQGQLAPEALDDLAAIMGESKDQATNYADRQRAKNVSDRARQAEKLAGLKQSKDRSRGIAAQIDSLQRDLNDPNQPLLPEDRERLQQQLDDLREQLPVAQEEYARERSDYIEKRQIEKEDLELQRQRKDDRFSFFRRDRRVNVQNRIEANRLRREMIERRASDRQYGFEDPEFYAQMQRQINRLMKPRSIWDDMREDAQKKFGNIADSFSDAVGQMAAKGGSLKNWWKNLWGEIVSWFTSYVVRRLIGSIESIFSPHARGGTGIYGMAPVASGGFLGTLGAAAGVLGGFGAFGASTASVGPAAAVSSADPASYSAFGLQDFGQAGAAGGPGGLASIGGAAASASSLFKALGPKGGLGKVLGKFGLHFKGLGGLAGTLGTIGTVAAFAPMIGHFLGRLFGHRHRKPRFLNFDDSVNDLSAMKSGRDFTQLFTEGMTGRMMEILAHQPPMAQRIWMLHAFAHGAPHAFPVARGGDTHHYHATVNLHDVKLDSTDRVRELADKLDTTISTKTNYRLQRGTGGGRGGGGRRF